jgi:hypothetical protein
MLSFVISLLIMFTVVAAAARWATREERRRNLGKDGHARHH